VSTNYTLTVTDSNGCTNEDEILVTVNALPFVNLGEDLIVCEGDCYTFTPQTGSGQPPYTLEWSSNTATVCPEETTTYSVTITDFNGCSSIDEIMIHVSPQPEVDAGEDVNICLGECVTFSPSANNGTPPYTFDWSGGGSTVCPDETTVYEVTVTDSNGCTSVDEITVNVFDLPEVDAGEDVSLCLGECFTFSPTATGGAGGFTFNWSSPEPTTCPEQTTTYLVTVTDANGCSGVDQIEIMVNTPLSAIAQQDQICEGDCIEYQASDFNLSAFVVENDLVTSLTFCENGDFLIEALDLNGCMTTITFSITLVAPPEANAAQDQILTCENSTVTLGQMNSVPGVSYEWSNGVTGVSQTVNEIGTYVLTATNLALGCSSTDTVTVTIDTIPPIANAGSDIELTCATPTATADGNASSQGPLYSYNWQTSDGEILNGIQSLTPALGSSGIYTLTVFNNINGCSAQSDLIVTTAEEPTINIESITHVLCPDEATGAISVSGSSGAPDYEYHWSTGSTTSSITNVPAGMHSVSLTDQNSCEVVMEIEVTEPPQLVLALSATAETGSGATDGTILATVSGGTPGYEYDWSTGDTTSLISGLPPEMYFLTITDENGCMAMDSARVNSFDCQNIEVQTTGTFYICPGSQAGSIQIEEITGGEAPYNILWSNTSSENSLTNLEGAHYSSTITDANNCEVILQFDIVEEDTIPPTLVTQDITLYLDENGTSTFSIEEIDAGSYDNCSEVNFEMDNITVDCSDLGSYEQLVVLADENGNFDTTQVMITIQDTLAPFFNYCPEDILSFNCDSINYDFPLAMDNCGIHSLQLIEGLPSGAKFPEGITEITYTATDILGNMATCNFLVTLQNTLEVSSSISEYSCDYNNPFSAALVASGGTPGYSYLWNDGTINSENILSLPGPWSWTTYDSLGCEQTGIMNPPIPDTIMLTLVATDETDMGNNGSIEALVNGGTGAYTYNWQDETGNPVGSEGILTDIPAGMYCLTIVDEDGCTANACITIENITKTSDTRLQSNIIISPNPTAGSIKVQFELLQNVIAKLKIMDINGRTILETNKKAEEMKMELDLGNCSEGIYLLKIEMEDNVILKKVLVYR
jgi:hypothetical protein